MRLLRRKKTHCANAPNCGHKVDEAPRMRLEESSGVHMLELARALLNGPSELQESTSRP
jgi:hypothetical protein